ncbi:zinc-binding dehydrogenase, partial [Nocardia sp. NPDC058497]|uniref:zinc-binding dehydrogenase n=1 Tax=Nocardia sp. NPDC058497 TaxID=3346529 RepID=UPI00364F2C4F
TRGVFVWGWAGAAKHEHLRALGADELIDYREVDVAEVVRDVDVVLDTLGEENSRRSLPTLRPGGLLVSILTRNGTDLPAEAARQGARFAGLLVEADHAGMRAVAALLASGELTPTIAGVFPLAEAAKAHAIGETDRTLGKPGFSAP